jgi:hypothetical protein
MSSGELYRRTLLENTIYKGFDVKHNRGSDKLAIIIDPRYDALMEAVIENFMYFMNPLGWNLLIVSWKGHRNAIMNRFPNCFFSAIDNKHVYMNEKGEPNVTIDSYNYMLMDLDFWKGLPSDYICIFQKDCIMFKMFPEYFIHYDFCGASWHMKDVSLFNEGINGGFSIRKRGAMVECLEQVTYDMIEEYRSDARQNKSVIFKRVNHEFLRIPLKKNEDVFFTYACEMLRKTIPDVIHRSFLAIEAVYNPNTCVYHGWHYNYHNIEMAQLLLRNSKVFGKQ